MLEELKNIINKNPEKDLREINEKLLSIALSTKERLPQYEEFYDKIFDITEKPNTIIDLGSGLNPLSFPFMKLNKLDYYSYDIDVEDKEFLNKYFKIMEKKGLNGKAEILDVRDLDKIKKLPKSDIVFMFKLVDLIDEKGRRKKKISEELIKTLLEKTKFVVATFATKTLTRKSMNLPRRIGFEMMLARNQLKFEMFNIENEVIYVVGGF